MRPFLFCVFPSLTIGASDLHTETLLSKEGDVTLILRTSSGEGKADENGEMESGVRDWGDSRVGDRGSKFRLWAESVLLWPLVCCCEEKPRWSFGPKLVFLSQY